MDAFVPSALVRGLQERAARAFPAELTTELDGWWLRHAPRYGWWVGSVLPHAAVGPDELSHRVARVEDYYAGLGTATRFQISPGAGPARLDPLLAARGYRRHGLMSLQVAETARVLALARGGGLRVRLEHRPTRGWLDVWQAVHGGGSDPGGEWDMLARVARPSAYARALLEGEAVAVGRAVADAGWAGVFGMATLPAARGRGAARDLLAALAGWAVAHADRMYLQVERDNQPALRLYARMGFTELCGYHYRVR